MEKIRIAIATMKKTIALCMIVKNESKIIKRCFDSVKDYIDCYVICDTGSIDGTQNIIREYWAKHNIPGHLHQIPWKNFGYNRTMLMKLSKNKADYGLLMDADFVLQVDTHDFKEKIDKDAYFVDYTGKLSSPQLLFINLSYDWLYRGTTHEIIRCKQDVKSARMGHFKIKHEADGANKTDAYKRDVELLLKESPSARTFFYLGQSYIKLGQWESAIKSYKNSIKLDNWDQQIYCSQLRIGYCMLKTGYDFEISGQQLLSAYDYRKTRLEALYLFVLECYYTKRYELGLKHGDVEVSMPDDILFVQRDIYDYNHQLVTAKCAMRLKRYNDSYRILKSVKSHNEEVARLIRAHHSAPQ
jgi:glycosyltransferase involved in cell wall biosynthesis